MLTLDKASSAIPKSLATFFNPSDENDFHSLSEFTAFKNSFVVFATGGGAVINEDSKLPIEPIFASYGPHTMI